MEESEFCNCQNRKNKTEKEYLNFRVIHKCSTKSTVYEWKRCEDCGELRLDKRKLPKA